MSLRARVRDWLFARLSFAWLPAWANNALARWAWSEWRAYK